MARIGFIGLGNMGGPMAANLVKAGHTVRGYDLMPAATEAAAAAGVTIAATAPEAVTDAEVVITMLPAGKHVLSAYQGQGGLLAAAPKGALFIDSSTIDVADARTAHAAAREAGMASLDAPVSGGVGGAAAGTLTFMCGGADDAFARAQPVLANMGRRIVHCGDTGAGQAAKICNNMILGICMGAVSEAFVLGEALGLTHQALFDVASTASGQCWALTTNCPVPGPVPASPANRDYRPGFATALMLKDMRLATAAAEATGTQTALGKLATELFAQYAEAGGAGTDFSGIINDIRARSGKPA
jgi:3-hydroxyisobutyrate dehydrogenase